MQPLELKVTRTLEAVESFSTLLDKETAALTKADYNSFTALQNDKLALAQRYQEAILAIEEDLPQMATLQDSWKDKLRQMHQRYQDAANANQKALLAAKLATERMVKLIMNAAKQTVMDGPSYSAAGVQGISDKLPIHFKLNDVF
jgi:hypothetical protein